MELPDLKGREAILRVHGKDVKMDESVDFNAIARATVGASGAELANIINEGALRAVRMGRRVVSQADLEESVETVIAGYQKKNASVSENERPGGCVPEQFRSGPQDHNYSENIGCSRLYDAGGGR